MTKSENGSYIHYGCGWHAPDNWQNFDASPTLLFERIPLLGRLYTKNETRFPSNVRYGDIVKGLPIPENASELVYCSHVLEHLSLEELRIALKNTYNILKPNGIFRFVMPDLRFFVQKYIRNEDHDAAIEFMRDTLLGKERRRRDLFSLLKEWLGHSQHLWMWDYKAIKYELQQAGFSVIRRAYYGDSDYNEFDAVEVEERWKDCLGVECKKLELNVANLNE